MLQQEVEIIEGRWVFVFEAVEQTFLDDAELVRPILECLTNIFDLLAPREVSLDLEEKIF